MKTLNKFLLALCIISAVLAATQLVFNGGATVPGYLFFGNAILIDIYIIMNCLDNIKK